MQNFARHRGDQSLNLPADSGIEEFCARTGFPELRRVSTQIESHLLDVVWGAAKLLQIRPLWIGYDRCCSVSRGTALPGSDLDHLAIVVDGDASSSGAFKKHLMENSCSELVRGLQNALIVPWSKVEEEASTPYETRDRDGEILIHHFQAQKLFEIIETARVLYSRLSDSELELCRKSDAFRNFGITPDELSRESARWAPKAKVIFRTRLVEEFGLLSPSERRLIIETLQWPSYPSYTRPPFLRRAQDNPHLQAIEGLLEKGLLHWWDPTDDETRAARPRVRALLDYMSKALLDGLIPAPQVIVPWRAEFVFDLFLRAKYLPASLAQLEAYAANPPAESRLAPHGFRHFVARDVSREDRAAVRILAANSARKSV